MRKFKKNQTRNLISDLDQEKDRYNKRAEQELLRANNDETFRIYHSEFINPIFNKYYELIYSTVKPGTCVLEIGAGTGAHTKILIEIGADITVQDISEISLEVLQQKIGRSIKTMTSDMESIPLKQGVFDCIICCNVLSYGSPSKVNQQIFKLLKPGGNLIIMDSLNGNYIYRLNRFLHYLRGERTKSTLKRIPDLNRINQFSARFEYSNLNYFGSYFWIVIPLKFLLGRSIALQINMILEKIRPSGKGAFKFIYVGQKFIT